MLPMIDQSYDQTIYAVVAACLLPVLLSMLAKVLGGFKAEDNKNPRQFLANTEGMAARANAAQINGYEVLPFFLAGVFFGMYFVIPQYILNNLVWSFVLIRVGYSLAYIFNQATLRSILWILSMACPFLIMKICLES